MSYNIQEFLINDSSAYLAGIDFTLNDSSLSERPVSCRSITENIGTYIQDQEYIRAYTDGLDRFLCGIKTDGSIEWVKGVPTPVHDEILQTEQNVCVRIDDMSDELKEYIDNYGIVVTESPEWIYVIVDADEKVLFGIRQDGTTYIAKEDNDTIQDIQTEMETALQDVQTQIDTIQETYTEMQENKLQMTLDTEDRIVSERYLDGTLHECIGIETPDIQTENVSTQTLTVTKSLEMTDIVLSDFESALKANGFTSGTGDWTEHKSLYIPQPRCAMMNITGITSMPTSKTQNLKATINVWDMQGNYFKKKAILNAQGSSSMGFIKKNFAADFCNDDWIGDDTFELRIGDWVAQDSYHFKAYYTDFFKGTNIMSYHIYDDILKTRGLLADRQWKLAQDMSSVTYRGTNGLADHVSRYDDGARCFPDGFPCIVYLNNEFYGIFVWQLKKHRDNYHMDKSTAENIHIDGCITSESIFGCNGTLDWDIISGIKAQTSTNKDGFEIRNPKDLYLMDGTEYDADFNRGELIDETSEYYNLDTDSDKVKKRKQTTAAVKQYLVNFSKALPAVKEAAALYDSDKTDDNLENLRSVINTYFCLDNLIDYLIMSDVLYNYDGFAKNWQWTTWDGVKWFVCAYDMDCTFGNHSTGRYVYTSSSVSHITTSSSNPVGIISKYFTAELEARYKELRDAGVINPHKFATMMKEWMLRIGTDFYEQEYERWPDAPCIKGMVVNEEYWEPVLDENGYVITGTYNYDASKTYNEGDFIFFGYNNYAEAYQFMCKQTCTGEKPADVYNSDNFFRLCVWCEERFQKMDTLYNYQ